MPAKLRNRDHQTHRTHRRPNALRSTPRLDAWIENLRPHLKPWGSQSDLARFLADSDDPALIRRWIGTFYKWLHRGSHPGSEELLAINEWLAIKKAAPKRTNGRKS